MWFGIVAYSCVHEISDMCGGMYIIGSGSPFKLEKATWDLNQEHKGNTMFSTPSGLLQFKVKDFCQQDLVIPRSHPSTHWPGLMLLNFGHYTSVFNMVRPLISTLLSVLGGHPKCPIRIKGTSRPMHAKHITFLITIWIRTGLWFFSLTIHDYKHILSSVRQV